MSQGEGGGRPRKFETPEEIETLSKAYFEWCDSQEPKVPYTVTGLAESLGTYRDVLIDYEDGLYDDKDARDDAKLSNAIKRAKAKVERYAEERSYSQTAGAVFNLVNLTRTHKHPWKNAQSTELTGKDGADLMGKLTDDQLDARLTVLLGKVGASPPAGREDGAPGIP